MATMGRDGDGRLLLRIPFGNWGEVGKSLRRLRALKGIQQNELAASVKPPVWATRLSAIEAGKQPVSNKMLLRLWRAAGVKSATIVLEVDAPEWVDGAALIEALEGEEDDTGNAGVKVEAQVIRA